MGGWQSLLPRAENTDPIETYSKVAQLKSLMLGQQQEQQQIQGAALENQQRQMQIDGAHAMQSAYAGAVKTDPVTNQPSFDMDAVTSSLAKQNRGDLIPAAQKSLVDLQEQMGRVQETKSKHLTEQADAMGNIAYAWKQSGFDPSILGSHMGVLGAAGYGKEAQGLMDAINKVPVDQRATMYPKLADQYINLSPKQRQVAAEELQAKAREDAANKPQAGQIQLSQAELDQTNATLLDRYKINNPKAADLPDEFKLKPGATEKDTARVSSALSGIESAQATKAQRDSAEADRSASRDQRQHQQDESDLIKSLTTVTGIEPKTGKEVMGPLSQAQREKWTDMDKPEESEKTKTRSARAFVSLMNGDPKNSLPGAMTLLDELDKKGELGTIASRWNDFMAGKVGDDPTAYQDFERLRVSGALDNTLLMNLHVGNRSGSYMMEHFKDLADTGKMDAKTLKAGFEQELGYAKSRARIPTSQASTYNSNSMEYNPQPKGATHMIEEKGTGVKHWTDNSGTQDYGLVYKPAEGK